ncbi:MAG: hypothetical protein ACLR4W_13405 [Oscillospiraceae bacterium]
MRFDGRDILRLPRAELRAIQGRELGVVFQEPMTAMDPLMRIGPQVEEALAVHTQLTKEQRRARALEALHDVDLPRRRKFTASTRTSAPAVSSSA